MMQFSNILHRHKFVVVLQMDIPEPISIAVIQEPIIYIPTDGTQRQFEGGNANSL